MARALGIDYGMKRTGIAVTDPEQRIATPLEVVETGRLLSFLDQYLATESVEMIVLGEPKKLDGTETHTSQGVRDLYRKLHKKFPDIGLRLIDERFTSKMALDTMIAGGMKKKDRQKKGKTDKISATIILQSYLETKGNPI